MDIAVLGLQIDSRDAKTASSDLDEFTASSKRAENANKSRSSSSRTAASATTANTAATRANTAALQAQAAAARAVAYRQRMLAFQLNDIGVSLASGMNPLMVFVQQGAQIQQIYSGPGGATAALNDFSRAGARFGRLGIFAAVVGAGFVGLRDDIRQTTGEAVTLGNVFQATFDEIAGGINTRTAPAIAWLKEDFSKLTTAIIEDVRMVGDVVVNGFEFAALAAVAVWEGMPGAFADIGVRAAEGLINQVRYMAREVITSWNELMNSLGLQQFMTDAPANIFPDIELPNNNAGAASALGASLSSAMGAFDDSPMTEAFARIGQGAIELARAAAEAGDGIGSIGRAATQAGLPIDLLGQSLNAANDNMRNWSQIGSNAFSGFFEAVRSGTSVADAFESMWTRALDNVASRFLDLASNNIVNMLLGSFGGGLGGLGGFGGVSPSIGFGPGTSLPVYHSGTNFVPETGPAILQRGEAVIPANMNRAGGYSGQPQRVDLHVHLEDGRLAAYVDQRAAGVAVQVTQKATPGIVNQSVAATGGAIKAGQMDAPMGRRFGVSLTAKAR